MSFQGRQILPTREEDAVCWDSLTISLNNQSDVLQGNQQDQLLQENTTQPDDVRYLIVNIIIRYC